VWLLVWVHRRGGRHAWGRCRGAAREASVGLQPDRHALVLALDRLRVDVPATVVSGRARVEVVVALVGDGAVAAHRETLGGRSTLIALLLRCGWSENAATAVGVGEAYRSQRMSWAVRWVRY